jgi:hypothetical protein
MNQSKGTPGTGLPYENVAGRIWDAKAAALLQEHRLQIVTFSTEGVISVQIWGSCPRCEHELNVQSILTAPIAGLREGHFRSQLWAGLIERVPGGDKIPDDVEVGCGCDRVHPGAPEHDDGHRGPSSGCGVSFRVSTYVTTAAPSNPTTPR